MGTLGADCVFLGYLTLGPLMRTCVIPQPVLLAQSLGSITGAHCFLEHEGSETHRKSARIQLVPCARCRAYQKARVPLASQAEHGTIYRLTLLA